MAWLLSIRCPKPIKCKHATTLPRHSLKEWALFLQITIKWGWCLTNVDSSLKDKMCQKRTKGKSTHCCVTDSTLIQNITFTLKNFLSNNKTKADLTKYLAVKCLAYSNLLSANWRSSLWHQEQRPRAIQVFQMFYSHTAKKRRALCWSFMLSR